MAPTKSQLNGKELYIANFIRKCYTNYLCKGEMADKAKKSWEEASKTKKEHYNDLAATICTSQKSGAPRKRPPTPPRKKGPSSSSSESSVYSSAESRPSATSLCTNTARHCSQDNSACSSCSGMSFSTSYTTLSATERGSHTTVGNTSATSMPSLFTSNTTLHSASSLSQGPVTPKRKAPPKRGKPAKKGKATPTRVGRPAAKNRRTPARRGAVARGRANTRKQKSPGRTAPRETSTKDVVGKGKKITKAISKKPRTAAGKRVAKANIKTGKGGETPQNLVAKGLRNSSTIVLSASSTTHHDSSTHSAKGGSKASLSKATKKPTPKRGRVAKRNIVPASRPMTRGARKLMATPSKNSQRQSRTSIPRSRTSLHRSRTSIPPISDGTKSKSRCSSIAEVNSTGLMSQ